VTRLSAESEERDALAAIAAGRRELELPLRLDRVLRDGGRKAMNVVRAQGAEQIVDRLEELGRSRFRGKISLILDIEFPAAHNQPALTRAAKGYIDLLHCHNDVLVDDAEIDHLVVLGRTGAGSAAAVTIRCTPIGLFTHDYDRVFRIANELASEDDEPPPRFIDGKPVPFDPTTWGLHDFGTTDRELLMFDEGILRRVEDLDAQAAEQLAEDPDADVDYDASPTEWELTDPDVREDIRGAFEPKTAIARGHWLANQSLDALDRPGGPPEWLDEVRARDVADIRSADDSTPGCFHLPAPRDAPGTRAAWEAAVHATFAARLQQPPWRRARFPGPIALDIALRGDAASFKDVDNRARDIITQFNTADAHAKPVLGGYRVYRLADADVNDIRVRILPEPRLRQLTMALLASREFIAANRRERRRPLDPPHARRGG
jgi:hypothetical protein